MVPFGGWDMPLAYPSGTLAEHRACRTAAVAFDVSHLGTVRLEGPDAKAIVQANFTNDIDKIAPGRAQYTHLLDADDASVVDDIIVWWVSEQRFDRMPNASNTARVRGCIRGHACTPTGRTGADARGAIAAQHVTAERAIIAVQGPAARDQLRAVSAEASGV